MERQGNDGILLRCVRRLSLACLCVLLAAVPAARAETPIVAQDDDGRLYSAAWSGPAGAFTNWVQFDRMRGTEGPLPRAQSVALADFDNDGHPDLVAGCNIGHDQALITLYRNDGSNGFTRTRFINVQTNSGDSVGDLAAGDVNNDGNMDFLVCGDSKWIGVYLGDGQGRFRYSGFDATDWGSFGIDLADFDHDGNLDCVVGERTFNKVYTIRGNGDGTFGTVQLVGKANAGAFGTACVAAGDLDGDGFPDILASSADAGDVYLFRGKTNLTFVAGTNVSSLNLTSQLGMAVCDFNGDGRLDVVTASKTARQVRWLAGAGDGSFGAALFVGSTISNCLAIAAPPLPAGGPGMPHAAIQATQTVVSVGELVTLDGSASFDPDGTLVSNAWRFGDSTNIIRSSGAPGAVTHAYTKEGHFYPWVRVTDNASNSASASLDLCVRGATPVVRTNEILYSESYAATNGWPAVLRGTSLATDDYGVVAYRWDFDDGIRTDFEDGATGGWTAVSGSWAIVESPVLAGARSFLQSAGGGTVISGKGFDTGVSIEADVALVGGNTGGVGVVLGYNSATNWCRVLLRSQATNEVLVERFTPTGRVVMASSPLWFRLAALEKHHLSVQCDGGLIQVSVDGRYALTSADGALPPGRVGLSTDRAQGVMDDVVVSAVSSGTNIVHEFSAGSHAVRLAATDAAGQAVTNIVPVQVLPGTPPVADAGDDKYGDESSSVTGTWTYAFSAAASTDDFGIASYEWDWSYSAAAGFQASATQGVVVSHTFAVTNLGTNVVAVRVTDFMGQSSIATARVVLAINGQPPVAEAGPDQYADDSSAVEGVWWLTFSAAGSSDDHAIARYEWDWSYNPALGFRPSGYEGVTTRRAFSLGNLGTNVIAVRVWDYMNQSSVDTARVVLTVNSLPPTALLGGDLWVEWGYPLSFDGSGSTDDLGVGRFQWDFGDGSSGVGRNCRHIYRSFTNYTVSLVVYDNAEQPSPPATCTVHVVSSTPPTARAGGPYVGGAGGPPVYFDGTASSDCADTQVVQGVAQYLWDVDTAVDSDGDGDPGNDVDCLGSRPMYVYTNAGAYTARLTVVDAVGQSDSATAAVSVASNLPPNVLCVLPYGRRGGAHPVVSGQTAALRGMARDAGALTYQWDFGDGAARWPTTPAAVTNRYVITASHVYSGPLGKPFTAALTVWDSAGMSATGQYRVVIGPDTLETRADIAVERALWWLHSTQDRALGRWSNPCLNYTSCAASSALLAFQIQGHRMDNDPAADPYVETVRKGFDFLFTTLVSTNLSLRNGNNPDSNGNGIGVGVASDKQGHETGMAMDALAASQDLLAMAGTGGSNVLHRFFYDLETDMVDVYAWAQRITGTPRGGWRYQWPPSADSDNSVSEWPAIGMLAAQDVFGIRIPDFVKRENKTWLTNTYDGTFFGYADTTPALAQSWYSTTPCAMIQMALNGTKITDPLWRNTEDAIATNWPIESPSSKLYYAFYAFAKAMRLAKPLPVVVMQRTGLDWFDDPETGLKQRLVSQQSADGSWSAYYGQNSSGSLAKDLSTSWAIAMLTPGLFVPAPVARITAPASWQYGTPLHFRADESFHINPHAAIIAYEWDFDGDGAFDFKSSDPRDPGAVFTYADPHPASTGDAPAAVTVRLRVTDNGYPSQYDDALFTVPLSEGVVNPVADAGGAYSGLTGVPLLLDGSRSYDPHAGNSITNYEWDFDLDGVADIRTGAPTLAHSFPQAGLFYVGLRVTDNGASTGGSPLVSDWAFAWVTIELDSNSDGIPDAWAVAHGLDPAATNGVSSAGGDADDDGMSNWMEYRSDTDPTNSASLLKITGILWLPGGIRIEWQGGAAARQELESMPLAGDVSNAWSAIFTNLPPTALDSFVIDAGATNRALLYRIKADRN